MLLFKSLALLGYSDQAVAVANHSISYARQIDHQFHLAFVLVITAFALTLSGQEDAALANLQESMEISSKQRFPVFELMLTPMVIGWVQSRSANKAGHIDLGVFRAMVDGFHSTGGEILRPSYLGAIGTILAEDGDVANGLLALDEAIADANRTGEHMSLSDLWRAKGDILASIGQHTEAEKCLLQALDIARIQKAKGWELRAATSLARVWSSQGKRPQAASLLWPVYDWFTEGFGTPELRAAKVLLDELEA